MSARLGVMLIALAATGSVAAEEPAPIADNSFLIEEAYNQDWGVVQHIFTYERPRGSAAREATFTQEWPAPGHAHQLSVTVPWSRTDDGAESGFGDVALNYRWQAIDDDDQAFAPRLSLILPTGNEQRGLGDDSFGAEVNLPWSVRLAESWVGHVNLGASRVFGVESGGGSRLALTDWFAGGSVVWLAHPKLNLLVEAVWESSQSVAAGDRERDSRVVVSPGVRAAFDFASGLQVVPGLAFPMTIGDGSDDRSIFLYLSFEHPFRRARQ